MVKRIISYCNHENLLFERICYDEATFAEITSETFYTGKFDHLGKKDRAAASRTY